MIYEALFLPVTEENERREAATKRGREEKERREEWRGESVKSEPKGKEDRRVRRRHPSPCDPSAENEDGK